MLVNCAGVTTFAGRSGRMQMARPTSHRTDRSTAAQPAAMAIGSMELDRHRDIDDLNGMRRVVLFYMPLLALTPVVTATLYLIGR